MVFDAGQNSADNFAHLAGSGLHYIGSAPYHYRPDLAALPSPRLRTVVDDWFEAGPPPTAARSWHGCAPS